MRVSEGTSYELPDGSWQKPEVELDDADFERAMVEWGIPLERAAKLPLLLKYTLLSTLGRQMLLTHQIQQRIRDTKWVKEEGQARFDAIGKELNGLFTQITEAK